MRCSTRVDLRTSLIHIICIFSSELLFLGLMQMSAATCAGSGGGEDPDAVGGHRLGPSEGSY